MFEIKYFAYGSNMDPERLRKREIYFSQREHAILKGWRLVFNKIAYRNSKEGYANIVAEENRIVEGILYEIQGSDLSKLDRYEGCPLHYIRIAINIQLNKKKRWK